MISEVKNKFLNASDKFFSRIPLLKNNSLQLNFIILLASFTYIVITVDLQTDMAVEKGEIATFSAILTNSFNSSAVDVPFDSYLTFPLIGFIHHDTIRVIHSEVSLCLKDRAPPALI